MAKAKVNKSAAIREALTAQPDKSATVIAKDLSVATSMVYKVKADMKKNGGKPKGKPGRKPGSKNAPKAVAHAAPSAAHAALDSAFEFVTKVGGLLHAEQLIAKLKSIKERL